MKCNMSGLDRILRIIVSVAVAVFFFMGLVTGIAAIVLGVLAVILFLTSVVGFCPVYWAFSTGTKKACPAEPQGPDTV